MKSRMLTCITTFTLLSALAIPVRLAAQDHHQQPPTYSVLYTFTGGTDGGSGGTLLGNAPSRGFPGGSKAGVLPAITIPLPPIVHVRPNIEFLTPTEVASLRKGFQVMMSRNGSDPTSFIYQANIHGTYDTPTLPLWNTCQHGSYFFFSWHRMYLYFFERILREASGDPNLALPYWDWSVFSALQIPTVFRQPADSSNPLYVSLRDPTLNAGGKLPPEDADYSVAFSYTNFSSPTGSEASFGGQIVPSPVHRTGTHGALEKLPHDLIHGDVGGSTGLMNDVNTAARDPIFWLHHANVDRLWQHWLDQGGGRADPSDSVWLNTKFNFYDETGKQVTLSGKDILNTVLQLDYRYDEYPILVPIPFPPTLNLALTRPASPVFIAASSGAPIELGVVPVSVTITLSEDAQEQIDRLADPQPRKDESRLSLSVEGIQIIKMPESHYRVYLDLPEGVKPDYPSPYYVGSLPFFGLTPTQGTTTQHAGHEQGPGMRSLDLTRTIRGLKLIGQLPEGKATLTFVMANPTPVGDSPLPVRQPGVRVRFDRLVIRVEPFVKAGGHEDGHDN